MKHYTLPLFVFMIFSFANLWAQPCDCLESYRWVKETFEANDSGYSYILEKKGAQAYMEHTAAIEEKIRHTSTLEPCLLLIREWLYFFRKSHIGVGPLVELEDSDKHLAPLFTEENWPRLTWKQKDIQRYLDRKNLHHLEGYWLLDDEELLVVLEDTKYHAYTMQHVPAGWQQGQLRMTFTPNNQTTTLYHLNKKRTSEATYVLLDDNTVLLDDRILRRRDPKPVIGKSYASYARVLEDESPYFETLSPQTNYLRIPSFDPANKVIIDSLLRTWHHQLVNTPNFILDLRGNGGGSDATYQSLIQYLYTDPIRIHGVEFYSTPLNNERMLKLIEDPSYGLSDEAKKWAQESHDKLSQRLGEFVQLNDQAVATYTLDTVLPMPTNVAILIDKQCGSSTEQFLLEMRTSRKVKLYGITTLGALDMSNMHILVSPSRQFRFGYTLSRSIRIPHLPVDEIGIQPDIYLDSTIPPHQWVEFVQSTLER